MKGLKVALSVLLLCLVYSTAGAQVFFTAQISGDQSVPAISTPATATAWGVLNTSTNTLTYRITYANLSSSFLAAHFHLGAAGVNGPVVMPIMTFSGNTAQGQWTNIPDTLVSDLMQGDIYINIHSQTHPAGEIRGQVEPAPGIGIAMSLDGAQDVPALSVDGTGTGFALFKPGSDTLTYRLTVAGLTSSLVGSHFHLGPAGTNGPVVFPFNMTDSTTSGMWVFPDTMWTPLITDSMYVNIHTSNHPAGEIRGQFMLEPSDSIFFATSLDGSQTVPTPTTNATATAWALLDVAPTNGYYGPTITPQLMYRVTYANLDSTFLAAHFHLGAAGVNGPVVMPITTFAGNTAQGTWSDVPDSLIDQMLMGNIYINIHSKKYPAGEIRGQLQLADGTPFSISLSSAQSVPSLNTMGTGTGWAILDTTGTSLSYRITVASLSSTLIAAHFHLGAAGTNGPVVHPFTYVDSTAAGVWTPVADTLLPGLLNGMIYSNFHTTDNPAGEIRGQLLLDNGISTPVPTAVKEPTDNVPQKFSLGQNYPNPFNPSTIISYNLPEQAQVRLDVYNILGEKVSSLVDKVQQAGLHEVTFDASRLASGVYFYRLSAGQGYTQTRKMILLK